jgi:hypothetical protein
MALASYKKDNFDNRMAASWASSYLAVALPPGNAYEGVYFVRR